MKSIRPTWPGDVPRGYALSSITSLTYILFDPEYFGSLEENIVVSNRPMCRNPCVMIHLFEARLKNGTQAVTVCHRGKRISEENGE